MSNSARALTIPCRDLTMTWHVINRMLERTDTCSEAVVISDELAGGSAWMHLLDPYCLREAGCDAVVDIVYNDSKTCICWQNDLAVNN